MNTSPRLTATLALTVLLVATTQRADALATEQFSKEPIGRSFDTFTADLLPVLNDPAKAGKPAALTQHPRPAYYDRTAKGVPEAMGYSQRAWSLAKARGLPAGAAPDWTDDTFAWQVRAALRYLLTRTGPLAMSVNQAGAFLRSRASLGQFLLAVYFATAMLLVLRGLDRTLRGTLRWIARRAGLSSGRFLECV